MCGRSASPGSSPGVAGGMPADGRVLLRRFTCREPAQHFEGAAVTWQMLDGSVHERRREQRMQDPEYRAAYERAAGELAKTGAVIRRLTRSGLTWACPRPSWRGASTATPPACGGCSPRARYGRASRLSWRWPMRSARAADRPRTAEEKEHHR